ncbi:hypothetical protein BDM02DRAFT_2291315 [Thelephora ganbajun]|uniref:Uncharacterized protein n=1 Tax=Thelephora ganbajun TaxID=370292 RepID=A0ACB6ZG47_THEGA|nr:hypothetical protein BDM02DRAFT_2291315 [Thelephora ganbajun]
MLIINPESSCDICLEQFALDGQSRAPHAPRCGHVFCLRCLKSLTRRVCPMCRNPFQPGEVTRIHLDQRARSSSVVNSPTVNSPSPSDSSTMIARELHDRINSFVQAGASTSVAHTLTEDCKTFFQENPPANTTYQASRFLRHVPTPQPFPSGLLPGLLPRSCSGRQVALQVPGGGTGVPQILGNQVPKVDEGNRWPQREAPTGDYGQGERSSRTSDRGCSRPGIEG